MKTQSDQAGMYLIHLVRCALWQIVPEERPEKVEWAQVFRMAYRHKIVNLTYQSVKRMKHGPETRILSQWRLFAQKAELTEVMYEAELAEVIKGMEQAGIRYLCLKGIVMRKLYPSRGMREMADQDIFYDAGQREKLMTLMKERGYEYDPGSERCFHDVFRKSPNYMFEMHKTIVDSSLSESSYYETVWDRAVKNEDGMYGYHMTWEDFYIYQMIHLKKHYERCGAGVKMMADLYVLYRLKKNDMDWKYVKGELQKLDAAEFSRERMLNVLWMFGTEEEKELAETEMTKQKMTDQIHDIIRSGAYGTVRIGYEKRIKNAGGKARYLYNRVFMPYEEMKRGMPFVENRRWLCPFINLYRIFVRGIPHSRNIWKEIKIVSKIEKEE